MFNSNLASEVSGGRVREKEREGGGGGIRRGTGGYEIFIGFPR